MNVYYEPEKVGLEVVTMFEAGGPFEFDMLVVWLEKATGRLLWARDYGCSCPTPFEGMGLEDLEPLVNGANLMEVARVVDEMSVGGQPEGSKRDFLRLVREEMDRGVAR